MRTPRILITASALLAIAVATLPVVTDGAPTGMWEVDAKLAAAKDSKIGIVLLQLSAEYSAYEEAGGIAALKTPFFPSDRHLKVVGGRVAIEAVATEADVDELYARMEKLGLKRGSRYGRMISGMFPVNKLNALGSVKELRFA